MKNIILTAKRNYFKLKFKISDNDFIACGTRGDIKKTQWYIDNGVDIDAGYQDGTNLLHYLCVAQNREMNELPTTKALAYSGGFLIHRTSYIG